MIIMYFGEESTLMWGTFVGNFLIRFNGLIFYPLIAESFSTYHRSVGKKIEIN